jgi:hypothetical protein
LDLSWRYLQALEVISRCELGVTYSIGQAPCIDQSFCKGLIID